MESIKKIIKLIQKTGDRFIVWETESQTPYVVLSLAEYENLVQSAEIPSDLLSDLNDVEEPWKNPLKNDYQGPDLDDVEESLNNSLENDRTPYGSTPAGGEREEKETSPEDHYYFEPLEG